jgi:multidrug efflux pump subunit AcrB
MRLVLAALGRPLTVIVALIAIIAGFSMAVGRMRMDIFPEVGNPVIYVAQPYGGMTPAQMEGFLPYCYEYHFLYITGIQAVDSKSVQGAALMKLTFREGTNMQQAMAETVGYVNRARAFMPPGTVPPFITRFDPGSVAVGLLLFTSNNHTQGELQNIALNQVRPLFATLPGVSAPPPFGGNQRTIVVTLDPDKRKQYGVSPEQAIAAVSSGTVVSPSGNLYDGTLNRIVRTNSTLGPELNDLMAAPIHPRSGVNIYLRDIGTIENGTDIVTAYAHVDGRRTVYIPVTKRSDASTLAVIQAMKAAIPSFKKVMPDDVDVQLAFDQSGYVSNAINGLVREAALGAILTGLVVLLFLRDWRGAFIVVVNIPFALFTAVLLLWATGQTINIMTLGGLALAVGVLVDEATVEVENIHTQFLPGVSRARTVLEACRRTVVARLLSMLCVLAVFVPSFFMNGVGQHYNGRKGFVLMKRAEIVFLGITLLFSTSIALCHGQDLPPCACSTGLFGFADFDAGTGVVDCNCKPASYPCGTAAVPCRRTKDTGSAFRLFPTIAFNATGAAVADSSTATATGALTTSSISDRFAYGGNLVQMVTDFGRTSALIGS